MIIVFPSGEARSDANPPSTPSRQGALSDPYGPFELVDTISTLPIQLPFPYRQRDGDPSPFFRPFLFWRIPSTALPPPPLRQRLLFPPTCLPPTD